MVRRTKYSEINGRGASVKTYNAWRDMNRRCYEKDNKKYPHYGARGITVCKRWHHDNPKGYINFFNDLGVPPEGYSLDRIDVDGNYTPKNCRWADKYTQSKNRRQISSITSFSAEDIAKLLKSMNDNKLLEVIKHMKRKR